MSSAYSLAESHYFDSGLSFRPSFAVSRSQTPSSQRQHVETLPTRTGQVSPPRADMCKRMSLCLRQGTAHRDCPACRTARLWRNALVLSSVPWAHCEPGWCEIVQWTRPAEPAHCTHRQSRSGWERCLRSDRRTLNCTRPRFRRWTAKRGSGMASPGTHRAEQLYLQGGSFQTKTSSPSKSNRYLRSLRLLPAYHCHNPVLILTGSPFPQRTASMAILFHSKG